jgi:hypothetical protein
MKTDLLGILQPTDDQLMGGRVAPLEVVGDNDFKERQTRKYARLREYKG